MFSQSFLTRLLQNFESRYKFNSELLDYIIVNSQKLQAFKMPF